MEQELRIVRETMEQTVQEKLSFISKLEAEHAGCAENLV